MRAGSRAGAEDAVTYDEKCKKLAGETLIGMRQALDASGFAEVGVADVVDWMGVLLNEQAAQAAEVEYARRQAEGWR